MMKVVLVHGRYFNSWEALGLGYIGAYIKQNAPNIELEYFQGCFDDDAQIIASCEDAYRRLRLHGVFEFCSSIY